MSRPLFHGDPETRSMALRSDMTREQFKPLANAWQSIYSVESLADANDARAVFGLDPLPAWVAMLLNGWTQPDPPKGTCQYRRHADGSPEFKGHLVPGSSGTVAFVLPGLNYPEDEPNYLPPHDVSFLADVEVSVDTFTIARWYIDSVTGEVTITFPAS